MSGHSKWSTIKRQKGAADIKRGQQFSKLSRAITIAAKDGGTDPSGNPRLKLAIEAARAANMPKDNINRAIDKVINNAGESIEEVVYEGYGPAGAALLVQVVTDNRNRTLPEIRSLFAKHGGNLGEAGSVAWMFQAQGVIVVDLKVGCDRDELGLVAIEAGANDVEEGDDQIIFTTDPAHLTKVSQVVETYGEVQADLQLIATTELAVDPESEQKIARLIDALEDHDDVQRVSTNALLS
jgi:YebC/PmpR family DNA-binding regulatory protein